MSIFRLLLTCLIALGLPLTAAAADPTRVELTTTAGRIVLDIDGDKAPLSARNFLQYVNSGFYNGTIFHRVIDGFMIQGGGFTPDLNAKPTQAPIQNEARNGLRNQAGTIAMARTRDPHSATAQFFINLVDNSNLDHPSFDGWGYAVFGKVSEGFDVVQKIGKSATRASGAHQNLPVDTIRIESARVLESTPGKR